LAQSAEIDVKRAMAHLGGYVHDFRKEALALTQQELAERAGIDRNTLARLEAGQFVSLEVLLRVWHSLGILDNFFKIAADQEVLAIQTAKEAVRRMRERTIERDSQL